MSGRCRSCNSILDEQEIKTKWPGTNDYTNLCFNCLPDSLTCLEEVQNDTLCKSQSMS